MHPGCASVARWTHGTEWWRGRGLRPEVHGAGPRLFETVVCEAHRRRLIQTEASVTRNLADIASPMSTVDSAGVRIRYEIHGEGPAIVLIHGLMSSFDHNWRKTSWVEFLLSDGRPVIELDCRGHDHSERPHDADAYSGQLMADDIVAVMDDIALDRADIMGYSMGGWLTVNVVS